MCLLARNGKGGSGAERGTADRLKTPDFLRCHREKTPRDSPDTDAGNGLPRKLNWSLIRENLSGLFVGKQRSKRGKLRDWGRLFVQVAVTCKHGQLSANQQAYIREKSEKLLNLFERVTAIGVTVTFENGGVRVEILVDAEHKHNFVADDSGSDVAPVFDVALHRMEQQIRKYKEKIQDHRRD